MSCNSKNFSKPRNFLLLEKYFGRFYNFVSGSGMTPAILGNDIIHIPEIFRIWSFRVFEEIFRQNIDFVSGEYNLAEGGTVSKMVTNFIYTVIS